MRHVYTGTTEYLYVTVTSNVTLDTQPVEFRFGTGGAWVAAAWVGTAGTQRQARLLLNGGNTPAAGTHDLYVRVTDATEIPVVNAGQVSVH